MAGARGPAHGTVTGAITTGPSVGSSSVGLVKEALGRHARDGEPLEAVRDATARARLHQGWSPDDPLLSVSLTALAREAGARRIRPAALAAIRPLVEQAVAAVGVAKPWGRQAGHVPLAGDAGTTPWTLPLDERGIRDLTGYAHTACLLLTAALTGMRESELMELRHGCRSISRHGDGMTRYPQATHHPCHRPVWADAVTSTAAFIGSLGRTRTAERTRLQAELDRAQRVVDSIDAATSEAGDHADQR